MHVSFDFNFWTLLLFVMNFGLGLFVAVSNRHKAAAGELKTVKSDLHGCIKEVESQVVEQGQRLAAIESDVENGITKEDLSAVYNRVNEIVRVTGPMQGRLDEISKNMERIDNHLIELLRK